VNGNREEVWWGLFNRNGALCYVDDRRAPLMEKAADIWGKPWRHIRRGGLMYVHRVIVDTQEAS
jgi:hypothetical protein